VLVAGPFKAADDDDLPDAFLSVSVRSGDANGDPLVDANAINAVAVPLGDKLYRFCDFVGDGAPKRKKD
jgi:hypothetical protein